MSRVEKLQRVCPITLTPRVVTHSQVKENLFARIATYIYLGSKQMEGYHIFPHLED